MNVTAANPVAAFTDYSQRLQAVLQTTDWSSVGKLAEELHD